MQNITDVNTFTSPVTVLSDGDAVAAANSIPTAQALANRTAFLNSRISLPFGDGSDGSATITTSSATISDWLTSGVMQRDVFLSSLTISGSGSLNTNGYRIFVSGILDVSAAGTNAIQCNGNAGGVNLFGAALVAQTVGGSGVGGNLVGSVTNVSPSNGGGGGGAAGFHSSADTAPGGSGGGAVGAATGSAGGAGGVGTSGTGSAGGSAQNPAVFRYPSLSLVRGASLIGGGAGGGGGAGSGNGGGGGSGGGVVFVSANTINRGSGATAPIISAIGGAGGISAVNGNGSSGGGGGGGYIFLVYLFLTGTALANALAATGGAGHAGYDNGGGSSGGGGGGAGGVITTISWGGSVTTTMGSAGTAGGNTTLSSPGAGGAGGACAQTL
jgi:hypothetical protein